MDPFRLLKKDHRTVSEMFERIQSARGQAKLASFKKLKTELDVHAHIEETIFYPALKNAEASRDSTLEAYVEHKIVKDLLGELSSGKPGDQWNAKLLVLKENVDHHVEEEEGELFDKAKEALTDEQLDRLGDEMAAEKQRQGLPVSEAAVKPSLLGRAVNALFGSGKSPNTKKDGASKKAGKRKAARPATKKSTATKKSGTKKATRATKSARKSTTKKSIGRQKSAAK